MRNTILIIYSSKQLLALSEHTSSHYLHHHNGQSCRPKMTKSTVSSCRQSLIIIFKIHITTNLPQVTELKVNSLTTTFPVKLTKLINYDLRHHLKHQSLFPNIIRDADKNTKENTNIKRHVLLDTEYNASHLFKNMFWL